MPAPAPAGEGAFLAAVAGLAEVVTARCAPPVDLVGYSLGGRLVLGLVVERPDLVRRAVAIGSSAGIGDAAARKARAHRDDEWADLLESRGLDAFLERWYAQDLFAPLRASPAFEGMLARRRRGDARALAQALRALSPGRQPPLKQRLAAARTPLLLVAGARDEAYVEANRALARRGSSLSAREIPGAGHCPHLETPDALLEVLQAFLEAPDEGRRRRPATGVGEGP
jgi:2-succinyl-6-hydroxy-2,4-cyclohexadiene-1-carboxylate synthase